MEISDMTKEDVISWFKSIGAFEISELMIPLDVDGSSLLMADIDYWRSLSDRLPNNFERLWENLSNNGYIRNTCGIEEDKNTDKSQNIQLDDQDSDDRDILDILLAKEKSIEIIAKKTGHSVELVEA